MTDYSYFDYHTDKVKGNDIFDIRTTGNDKIDIIKNPSYYERYKNLKGEIKQISPKEYFIECAKIFDSTPQKQIDSVKWEKDYIGHLKSVLTIKEDKFPLTYLDYANNTQEGRHRMYVAGELFGWDTKFPVLVVDFADEQRAKEEQEQENQRKIEQKVEKALVKALSWTYESISSFIDMVEFRLSTELDEENIDFDIQEDEKGKLHLVVKGIDIEFNKSDISIEDSEEETDNNSADDIDIFDFEDLM